jgi:hypothetical protein
MKMWIVLGRLSYESEEVALSSKCSVTDAANDCPVFFGIAYVSNHTNYRESGNLLHVINSLGRDLRHICAHKFWKIQIFYVVLSSLMRQNFTSLAVSDGICVIWGSEPPTEYLEHE